MTSGRRIYYISEHSNQELIHGGVGPVDIEAILERNNAIPIRFPYHFDFSVKAKIARFGYLLKTALLIRRGSLIVFQHPLYARMNKLLLMFLRLRRSIQVICLVADIDGLKNGNNELLQKEMRFFKTYKHFILHNPNMEAWFRAFHPSAICTFLTCFDFLTNNTHHPRSKSNTIIFAGNLQKSKFLEKLHIWLEKNHSLYIHLYGPYITDVMLISDNVSYKGLHRPYSLPDLMEGSFGLIWDGEELEEPAGSLGIYMHYISHHKLSLYIVSNLPVIVHENAGSAQLIKKFNIGFTVNSLFEIEDKISNLSEEEYDRMVQNTYGLAKEITAGNRLQKALAELLNEKGSGTY